MATELENLVPEADVEVEGMRGPKGDKGDSYVLTEADKEEIAQKVDKIIDAETDKTLTLSGKPADAKAAGDVINDLKADLSDIEDSVSIVISEVEETVTPSYTKKDYYYLDGNGNPTASTLVNDRLLTFSVDGVEQLMFKVAQRAAGGNKYAFYTADSFENCGSETIIGNVRTYSNWADNTVTVPDGAKMVLMQYNGTMDHLQTERHYKVSKGDANFANPYSATKVYYVGEYCLYEGAIYRRATYTGTYGAWDSENWEEIKVTDDIKTLNDNFSERQYFTQSPYQKGRINSNGEIVWADYGIVNTNIIYIEKPTTVEIASGYSLIIYYYNSSGAMTGNNGGLTTWDARTILPGRYVRFYITITGSTATVDVKNIPTLVHAISYKTDYVIEKETIQNNVAGSLQAVEAKMFQKGSSPKTFYNAPCILVAGQSNIDGRVPVDDLPSEMAFPYSNIKVGKDDGTFYGSMGEPVKWDITTSMFYELNKLGTDFYTIKKSEGGTSVCEYGDSSNHWTPFYEKITGGLSHALLLSFDNKIKKCVKQTPNTFDIKAFVWQQGEGDRASTSKYAALNYYKNFKCLIAYVRGIAGNEKLPVICGTVSHLSGQYDAIVEAATLQVAEEDSYVTCIDMSGATLLDAYHFDADSAIYFGQKAYDALIDFGVITGTKINPTPPWENA